MTIGALDVFEELRFILELLAAELLFVLPHAKKRNGFAVRFAIGIFACIALSFGYFFVLDIAKTIGSEVVTSVMCVAWYVLLSGFTFVFLKVCFVLSTEQILFFGIAGYALQHIEYSLINEMIGLGLAPSLRESLWLYGAICALSFAALMIGAYCLLVRRYIKMRDLALPRSRASVIIFAILYVILIALTFMGQSWFHNGNVSSGFEPNYWAVASEVLTCLLVLMLQYVLYAENVRRKEYEIVKQLLYENGKQYAQQRETIDAINRKCHDLKHQIAALKQMRAEERNEQIDEIERVVMIYDMKIDAKNQALNTILMDKQLLCLEKNVRLSFFGDGSLLDFVDTVDLYTLFGNAIDNAVECVSEFEDEKERCIDLTIEKQGNFVLVRCNNFYRGTLVIKDGFPQTIKPDQANHGFGLKSIKLIAEKYGGTVNIRTDEGVFSLRILLLNKN